MKAKEGVVDLLNGILRAELTAVHQYLLHAAMSGNWGYERLQHEFRELASEEFEHSSQLIDHILYLDGNPDVGEIDEVSKGASVEALFEADLHFELQDVEALRKAIPDHKVGLQTLLQDPAAGLRSVVRILRAWAVSFATIEPRIAAMLERDHALRAADRGTLKPVELIEDTTGGIRWLPEVGVKRVILAPTYFSRPYNILLAGPDWRFFAYPVADEALEPDDRLAPPPAVVRLHRALGDDTRLRILKLLSARDLYLTEIAQQLDLSKPTIKHHLAQLRAAGLVTVIEAGSVIYYSLRRDRIEAASADLARFLNP